MRKINHVLSMSLLGFAIATAAAAPSLMEKRGGAKTESGVRNEMTRLATRSGIGRIPLQKAKQKNSTLIKTSITDATILPKGKKQANAQIPDLWGSVISTENTGQPLGIYSLGQEGWQMQVEGPVAYYGGVLVDDTYYCVNYGEYLGMSMWWVNGYDIASGDKVSEDTSMGFDLLFPGGLSVDPVSGKVIGIGYNDNATGFQISEVNFGHNSTTVTELAQVNAYYCASAIAPDGTLYAIKAEQDQQNNITGSSLCTLDRKTGIASVIGSTGVIPQYISGATIDQATGRMYWAVSNDVACYLCELDLTTGEATRLMTFENGEEVNGLFVKRPEAASGAPGKVTDVTLDFFEDSLDGTLTCTAPSTLFGSQETGKGPLTLNVYADGTKVGSATASWGATATVEIDLTLLGTGRYDITVAASNAVGEGPATKIRNVWVGPDVPVATEAMLEYENGEMHLTWLPVAESVNGGWIDLDRLTYMVVRRDGTVAARGLKETSFSEQVAAPAGFTEYSYTVYVVVGSVKSAPAESNVVGLGSVTPPYVPDFSKVGLAGYTVIDSNNDGLAWQVDDMGALLMKFNQTASMDDWLITPPIALEAGKAYAVSFRPFCFSSAFPEKLEVKYGSANTVDAMTSTIMPETVIDRTDYMADLVTEYIYPETDGLYYIGFHGISDANQFYLYVDDFQVGSSVDIAVPGTVADFKTIPDQNGGLAVEVSFTTPSTTMKGDKLEELTAVDVMRDGTVIKTFDNPGMGIGLSYSDALTQKGEYTYSVVARNSSGSGDSVEMKVTVGLVAPAAPGEVMVSRTSVEGQALVEWTPVTVDENGKTLPEGAVTYNVCLLDEEGNPVVIAPSLKTTTYSYQAAPRGYQTLAQCLVYAEYDGMESSLAISNLCAVGRPYQGLHEKGEFGRYVWGLKSFGGQWKLADYLTHGIKAYDGDDCYFYCQSEYTGGSAELFSGLVSLEGMANPGLTFAVYNFQGEGGEANNNELAVDIITADGTARRVVDSTIDELCNGVTGWHATHVPLDNFAGQVIQVSFTATTKLYTNTMLDGIRVAPLVDFDLEITDITAPGEVPAGQQFTIAVAVANQGVLTARGYSLDLYRDGEKTATVEGESLLPDTRRTYSFPCVFSPDCEETASYQVKLNWAEDQIGTNNESETVTVSPIVSKYPRPSGLQASETGNAVQLTWDSPDLSAGEPVTVTEDFEDAKAWTSEYGDWKFVDADAEPIGWFDNASLVLPGYEEGKTTGSFFVWDYAEQGNDFFAAHSGTKYLFSMFRYDDGTADDWAVSPWLSGRAQTVSFYAKSYSGSYPEKIEVYWSTGSSNPADFVKVEGVGGKVPSEEWTLYEVPLPEGARRFAIRSCATAGFMLMVDDVTMEVGTPDYFLAGYNVYRNGAKLNSDILESKSYTDTHVVKGNDYTYAVTAVYKEGIESGPSNKVKLTFGLSSIDVYDAVLEETEWFSLDGLRVKPRTDTRGIYIRRAGDKVEKVRK